MLSKLAHMNRRLPYSNSEWRSILRSLLREASYLPDPIARGACHNQIVQRFRRYYDEPRIDYMRLRELHKKARYNLSLFQRANEGYLQPLEKVLRTAYGRRGRRRRELLASMLVADVPQDSTMVEELLAGPGQFEEGWRPPGIINTLLASQNTNAAVLQLRSKRPVRRLEPPIPKTNAWGRKVPLVRRRNIRREWYNSVLNYLLPPLPPAELQVLEGLISGKVPWKPTKRRSRPPSPNTEHSKGGMIRTVLTAGPPKGETFRLYENGRPHRITRRLMCRLWRRISCIVPRLHRDDSTGKPRVTWDATRPRPTLALYAKEGSSRELFGNGEGSRKHILKVAAKR
ncbi:hypothetical protein BJY01DRAFT_212530 [Aspergillus pseudoustus]|uniref:LYR motif-containing protein Cup1-like N-terminal domain-containing protein n=1 Tax=Aspergillus pseudoustus TaxID=1810923 RepID=A0ABR4K537_9EURO